MARTPVKIGILGCGVISGIYIETSQKVDAIELAAIADVNPEAAKFRAGQYGIQRVLTPEELLADPEIEIVVSLTPNRLHGQIGAQIIEAGKSLYSEKPFAVYREEALANVAAAEAKGLRTGGAPDTFFGAAWQTARKAIDDGLIGQPYAAFSYLAGRRAPMNPASMTEEQRARYQQMMSRPTRQSEPGHVSFFATDGGKYGVSNTFDMGGYYLANLINLLGPAKSVMGMTNKMFDEVVRMDRVVKIESPTHVTGIIQFQSGVLCQWLTSSDVYGTGLPHIEIYGTEGTLRCPDPNYFPGPVYLRKPDSQELIELENKHAIVQDTRGIGVADMAVAIKNGRAHRANGRMTSHVVDIMNALHESSDQSKRIDLVTTCEQPKALPVDLPNWTIDD
ncbi:MAG: Gfo/Idh/MocA family protein [Anaerolineae bacterium]